MVIHVAALHVSSVQQALISLKQCDEARPACLACTKTKLTCPGYRTPLDLIFRDQNKIAQDKVQGRKNQSYTSSNTNPAPANNAQVIPTTANALRSISLPNELGFNTPEYAATCVFFSNVVVINQHPDTRRGFMQALLPLYNAARPGSLLDLAITTVSLAMFGMSRRTQDFVLLGQKSCCKALLATGRAIEDPIDSLKDETLMAVLLLSLFEVSKPPDLSHIGHEKWKHRCLYYPRASIMNEVVLCFPLKILSIHANFTNVNTQRLMSTFESAELSDVHDAGAAALIKHRGKELNTRSYTSIILLYAVYTQVVSYRLCLVARAISLPLVPGRSCHR